MSKSIIFKKSIGMAFILMAMSLVGCSKTAFKVGTVSSTQNGGGQFILPPKVDILLVEDDTGSMFEAHEQVFSQIPAFLNDIQNRGWDYRFATIPLTTFRATSQIGSTKASSSQVMTSFYDPNWFFEGTGLFTPPFPGADPQFLPGLHPLLFRQPSDYSDFLTSADISNGSGGREDGFGNILNVLNNDVSQLPSQRFLRSDAMLAVFVISTGEDTTGAYQCFGGDGLPDWCGHDPIDGPGSLLEEFQNLKADPSMFRFYSAIADEQLQHFGDHCDGAFTRVGYRYYQMSLASGGDAFDVCSLPLSTVTAGISSHLEAQRLNFQTRYLVIGQEPDLSTLVVTKNGQALPNSAVNGWTYSGFGTVNTIDFPAPMNQQTGYIIELHGTAKAQGNDVIDIQFQPAGAQNSSS